MQINDSFIIQAPIESVWDFFMDVEGTSRCVPGVQSFEVIDDTNFRGELKVKVGPITAQLRDIFGDVVRGKLSNYRHWNYPVYE